MSIMLDTIMRSARTQNDRLDRIAEGKVYTDPETLYKMAASTSSTIAQAAQKAIQKFQHLSDSEVLQGIDNIALKHLGQPLTSGMRQQYLQKYRQYTDSNGMSPQQAFEKIDAEFASATAIRDVAFFESRTGKKLPNSKATAVQTTAQQAASTTVTQPVPAAPAKTAGASGGNNNLLIYGVIAAVAAYFLFGTGSAKPPAQAPKPGLSGAKKKPKSRTPAKRVKPKKAKGSPATKPKKSGRMQVIDL